MKRLLRVLSVLALAALLCACARGGDRIYLISREDGSGTRSAFVSLFGLAEERDGITWDLTDDRAEITNSTAVMMMSVSQDDSAIGYCSLGSLNSTVKALGIDGVYPSVENILSGSYPVIRALYVVTAGETDNPAAADFLAYILSREGQQTVEDSGYVPLPVRGGYTVSVGQGKVVLAGSSSVTPVMEKLREAYAAVNPGVKIEIQQSDSTTGIRAALDGICDIGMTSRALTESEEAGGAATVQIAVDGIAVIVSPRNPVTSLSREQVRDIYTGAVTGWGELS